MIPGARTAATRSSSSLAERRRALRRVIILVHGPTLLLLAGLFLQPWLDLGELFRDPLSTGDLPLRPG